MPGLSAECWEVQSMQVSEYLEAVTTQMRCKRARGMVEKELKAHIEDQADKYMEFGIPKEEAVIKAVEQMGDPIQVGADMDRLHRPDIDKWSLFLICLLSLGGGILYRWSIDMGDGRMFQIGDYFEHLLLDVLPGMLLMWLIIKIDYTRIARHPFLLSLALVMISGFFDYFGTGGKYGYVFLSFTLNAVLFGAILHKLRKYKLKGMLLGFLWLMSITLLYHFSGRANMTNSVNLLAIGMVLLGVAAFKDWFEVGRKKSTAIFVGLLCTMVLFCGARLFFYGFSGASYIKYRLLGWIGNNRDENYIFNMIRGEAEHASFFTGSGNLTGVGNENEYFIINLISRYGYLAAILVSVLLGLLFLVLFSGIKKQQNRLGTLMGVAAILTLCIPVVEHIAYNLSLIPTGSLILPFFSGTGSDAWLQGDYCRGAILGYYVAMGFCLSVYRSRNIVTEQDAEPGLRFKLKLERQ